METNQTKLEQFDERQSLEVIRKMIQVSQKKVQSDGILLIVWGYAMALMYFANYCIKEFLLSHNTLLLLKYADPLLPIIAFCFTLWYVFRQQKRAKSYVGESLLYMWITLFGSLVLTNLTLYQLLDKVDFTVQHPLFMILTAFAVVVTGIILRYKLIIFGGILFGVLAFICSLFPLTQQMLLHSIAWFVSIAIPGHILFHKSHPEIFNTIKRKVIDVL